MSSLHLPRLVVWIFSYKVFKAGQYAGYSNFSKIDLIENAKKDLLALNTLVGNKKFLFSDTTPCDSDFALFGNISQIEYNNMEPLKEFLHSKTLFSKKRI